MRTNVQGKRFPIKGVVLTTAVQPFEQNSRGKLEEGLNRFHVKGHTIILDMPCEECLPLLRIVQ
jgi:hypothetical protein